VLEEVFTLRWVEGSREPLRQRAGAMRSANFYEKALFVKGDVATALGLTQLLSALRARLLSALSVSPLFGDSVHRMRSVFSS
jgi:hypothetical protein